MTTKSALIAGLVLLLTAVAHTVFVYPDLPALVPIHWDIHGRVDGTAPKLFAALFGVGAIALMMGLLAVPIGARRGFTIEGARETFNYMIVVVLALFTFLAVVAQRAALHPEWNSGRTLVAGVLFALALAGNRLGKVRRNAWVGVRLPWTLRSERVWFLTHRLTAKLLVAVGLLGGAAVLLGASPAYALGALIAALVVAVVASWVLSRRHEDAQPSER